MKLVELKRKDGKPLYAQARAVSHCTESTESPKYCSAWIGGKEHTLGESLEEVRKKLEASR